MTFPTIASLYQAEQLDRLYKEGVFLAKRGSGNQAVLLFQYEKWYVEIYFRRYRCEVKEIVISQNINILNPYLQEIDLGELLDLAR